MFLIEGALCVFLAYPARCREVRDEILQFDSDCGHELVLTSDEAKMPGIQVADSLESALAKDLANVPEVAHVLTEWVDGPLLVWIAVDDPAPKVRRRIYQKQLGLIEGFPEIDFDFNLIPAMGRSAKELATGAHVVYTR